MTTKRSAQVRKRPRRPGEISTSRTAIRNHCLECMGWQSVEVSRCTAQDCHLWPYRMGAGYPPERTVARESAFKGQVDFLEVQRTAPGAGQTRLAASTARQRHETEVR